MPIHDWTQVDAGIFHAFHHDWITEIGRALNRGLLPTDTYALSEQRPSTPDKVPLPKGGVTLAEAPPKVRIRTKHESTRYAAKAKAVMIRHVSRHQVVAMVEVVSPGNKNSENGLNAFVRKAQESLAVGVHLLLVDLFPPSRRDPQGIHRAVWGDDCGPDFDLPADKSLTCVSYVGGPAAEAFVEPVGVGDLLPEMPLFLTPEIYVPVPLEATYQAAWDGMPEYWRSVLEAAAPGGAASHP